MLISIINDILDLSKVEAGKMEIIPAAYDLAELIADAVQINIAHIGSKRIKFKLKVDENLPATLLGDELRIRQIAGNILSNAIKYTEEGEIITTFSMTKGSCDTYLNLVITVSDTGRGMTQEQVDLLFDADYTRFISPNNHIVEGTGLGMRITNAFLSLMGGKIEVQSEPDKGSVFTISIPQKIQEIQERKIIGKTAAESLENFDAGSIVHTTDNDNIEPMPYGRVLVVDDLESNLYVAKRLLIPYGLHIDTAETGVDAVKRIKDGEVYDIIFMDHMMPKMDGAEATKILRKMGYDHPIVALTANVTFEISKVFLSNGFSAFIPKPIEPAKLHECLISFIKDKQTPEALALAKIAANEQLAANTLHETFLADAKKSLHVIDALRQIIEATEPELRLYKLFTTYVHGIKSALNNIEEFDLAETAGFLEESGKNHDVNAIKEEIPLFLENLLNIIRSVDLNQKIETANVGAVNEDTKEIAEKLLLLSKACEDYDMAGSRQLLDTIKSMPITETTELVLKEIEQYLFTCDDDLAAALAKDTAKKMMG